MRRRYWVILLFSFFTVSLLFSQLSSARTTLRVNEANTRVLLEDKQTSVSLSVDNPTGQVLPAHIFIEVLDPEGKIVTTAARDETLKKGTSAIALPLTLQLSNANASDRDEILWYRLRYRVLPFSGPTEKAEGIVSLSEITPDLFHVSVVSPKRASEGTRYRAQVRTTHPITSHAIKDASIVGTMELDNGDQKLTLKAVGLTDAAGYAALDFDLPKKIEDDGDIDLKVVARRGLLVEEAEDEVEVDRGAQIFVSTDKPIYQPGQTLHIRTLVFDATKHAIGDREATLEIEDPENKSVFDADLKTSRFGVASADWNIPDNLRLGSYSIKVTLDGDDDSEGYTYVKISRYDLPNFAVQVNPDHPFYLPGQNAAIEVHADYLFGHPVKRGHVRIVRETERHWNYQEQKWETGEGREYEGEADERGVFTANIDLAEETDKLLKEDYSRYHDLSYAAYVTDPTTNRTEQHRFDLRLTKSAIHVYVIEADSSQTTDFPLRFYLSTYYADGTPAQCEVSISADVTTTSTDAATLNSYEQPLRTIKTNRYGVAKVSSLVVPARQVSGDETTLTFLAHDAKGTSGRQTNSFSYYSRPVIRIDTDKTLYRKGEPLQTQIVASEPEMKVIVDVWQGPTVIRSTLVQLHNGRASLVVPYSKAFKDNVLITAYSYSGSLSEDRYNTPSAAHSVLYPRERDLKLDIRLDQTEYKPGEDAHAEFTVRDAAGRSIESALGVVIFDKAVEERARTDNEFGSKYSFYYAYNSLNGYEGGLSGLTTRDFIKLDLSKPVPEGMDLVAEVLFSSSSYSPHVFGGREYSLDQREIFSKLIASQVKPTEDALAARYSTKMEYPADETSLRRMLADAGLDLDQQRDPWGMPFRASFDMERELDVMKIESAGADKRFDTDDDFLAARAAWPYFRPLGEKLNDVVWQYHKRTGGYVHGAEILQSELSARNIDWSAQHDRWGKPFALDFGLSGTNFTVAVKSGGPNRKFETSRDASSDDFVVWTAFVDYFFEKREEISAALADHYKWTGLFPQTDKEFSATLERSHVNLDKSPDPWGHNYYVATSSDPRFGVPFTIQTYSTYEDAAKKQTEVSPLTQQNNLIRIRSAGADGKPGTSDDFDVAALSRSQIVSLSKGQHSLRGNATSTLGGASGAITGTITDPQGAVVPDATVTATNLSSAVVYQTTTDENGRFTLGNLPAGTYNVRFESPGFQQYIVNDVPVRSSNITKLDGNLTVAGTSASVEITSGRGELINATQSEVGYSVVRTNNFSAEYGKSAGAIQMSTPRLREYFPETLVWQPALETDSQGRAKIDFKLADNITTWKMAVIGSTIDGEIGVIEKEIRAFQPFFIEHDPPRVLTEGDEIQLPVVLRNYMDKPQAIELTIKPEAWFALLGPERKRSEVPSGDSSRETFDFRAISSVNDGKQRITAIGSNANDAIEKPVTVHPDGEERAVTASGILNESTLLELKLPTELIKGTLRGELKIYPNLMSHVAESVNGILQRPHGCGEQTISSTYPNLLILRFNKGMGLQSPISIKAQQYLDEGYKRLLNYRAASGGFSYWGGREEANFALTAYALRFLIDAREFLQVDEAVINGARDFLIKQQLANGSWSSSSQYAPSQNASSEDLVLTSYLARIIASGEANGSSVGEKSQSATSGPVQTPTLAALKRALDFLRLRIDGANDPYVLASYVLAASDSGEVSQTGIAIAKLRRLSQKQADGTISWDIETGTPFHGWGRAARIETTAIVLQALNRYCGLRNADCTLEDGDSVNPRSAIRIPQLLDGGLLYLIRQKDRYGVWESTQATVNVLNALVTIFSNQDPGNALAAGGDGLVEISVNGRSAASVSIPAGRLNNPILVDIGPLLAPGANTVELRRNKASRLASVQAVSTFYVPWSYAQAAHRANAANSPLNLAVSFSKNQTAINEEIVCKVEAVGRNYGGMLLAEIGLPPGADVDRASLERAMTDSGWSLSRYDVLPDRLIVYLWPQAGGTKFEFKFRTRFGLTAQSAPSLLYDYYNPEARVVVPPTRFVVK